MTFKAPLTRRLEVQLFEWAYYDEPTFVVAPPPEAALGGAPDSDGDGNGGDQLGADEPRYRPVY